MARAAKITPNEIPKTAGYVNSTPMKSLFTDLPEVPTIGKVVKDVRSEKKLSQTQLSELSGVTNSEISRIESGTTRRPSKEVLKKLSPVLGISYSELLFISGYSENLEDVEYYSSSGEKINYREIVSDVYKASSDLLVELDDIHTLSSVDIDTLISLIRLMKISYTSGVVPIEEKKKSGIFEMISSTIMLIGDHLHALVNLINTYQIQ